ncbi:MAG: phosphoribosylamine--glycine ligase [Spirochaetia bacterium]|nr:phosphoribosylamine--glycine ligase [Spirochaetia bacterium]
MNILILGGGGREHAMYLKIKNSSLAKNVYISPGNAGINDECRININIEDFDRVSQIVKEYDISLIVVGPEVPLVLGIKDYFKNAMPHLFVFGPDKKSAMLEGSKVFSDQFMKEAGIPAPMASSANNLDRAISIIEDGPLPIVIKADGLAAGKGVSIHHDKKSAITKLEDIFKDNIFGEAGKSVLIQEFLEGEESSLFALLNGKEALILPTARDYKAAYENNQGPNTGGMGSFSPGEALSSSHIQFACENIIKPVLDKFQYTGILYIGLMVDRENPEASKVLEFNCRFGDPETQSILPMIEGDIVPYLLWSCGNNDALIPKIKDDGFYKIPQKTGCALNVVIASNGYPSDYDKGIALNLPDTLPENIHIIHAGTEKISNKIVSNGGRVLNIVGYAKNLEESKNLVYKFIESLKKTSELSDFFYRNDIGSA